MLSNNAGDQIAPAAEAAQAAGAKVVTWDSPIPSGAGETSSWRRSTSAPSAS
jgi:rhamnose transport system substrate-binding protein